jgi:glycine cleavage system H lipoate-binding protein/ActR/RegA family two-component response regulator
MKPLDVLLAYDQGNILRVIGWALEGKGCRIVAVRSGGEAAELLSRRHFDAVVTDLALDPQKGFDVLQLAKQIDPCIKVVQLEEKDSAVYDRAGTIPEADDYVIKPCTVPALWKKIARSLKEVRLDQELDNLSRAEQTRRRYTTISGYRFADGVYYHSGHTWAAVEHGRRAKIGMDDFIAKLFGNSERVNLPAVGTCLRQGEPGWVLSRRTDQAPVGCPLSGTVLAVNPRMVEHPETCFQHPYEEGWLLLLEPSALKEELGGLCFGDERFRWIEGENQRLLEMLGPEYEGLAATGGEAELGEQIAEIDWDLLVGTFLTGEPKIRGQ